VRTIELGATGEAVSALSLGTMYFGSRTDEETAWELLDAYYEAGGRFLDTANIYATWIDGHPEPESEPLLGEWLAERGVREEMFLATKLGFSYADVPEGLDPDLIEQEVERSRERLGVETIDLLYAHVDDPDTPQRETMAAFQRVVDDGRVRHLGASNFPAWRLARANALAEREGWTPYSCVQTRYSYLIPRREADFGGQIPATDELVDYCDRAGLTMLAYTPLLRGSYGREDRAIPDSYTRTENARKLDALGEIADRHDATENQVVLAWMLGRDPPVVPVFGVSAPGQLEANLAALEVDLTAADRERLDGIERLGSMVA